MDIQRTTEEKYRENLLFDLTTMQQQGDQDGIMWRHFTDWSLSYDLLALLDAGFICRSGRIYIPDGSWQDHFPPTAYLLTGKGRYVLKNPANWVFRGLTADK